LDLGKRFLWKRQTKQSGSLVYAGRVARPLLAWDTVCRLDSFTREVGDEQKAQWEIPNGCRNAEVGTLKGPAKILTTICGGKENCC